jgi:integrase
MARYQVSELHKLRDGRLHVFKRTDCRYWMARFYADGRYKVASTKELTYAAARSFAENWYDDLQYRKKRGELIHDYSFAEAAAIMLELQKELVHTGERNTRHASEYEKKLKGVLLPFFGSLGLGKITTQKIEDFKRWRVAGSVGGKIVSTSTIHQDFVILRQVLKIAERRNWIPKVVEFPDLKIKVNVRSWFTAKEWDKLLKMSHQRIETAKSARVRWEREQLHDFMVFSVHSGLRQGELMGVRRKDIEVFINKDGDRNRDYLMVNVRGKTGERRVVAMMGAVRSFERLCERNKLGEDDLLFSQNHRDGLNELLKVAGLKYDSMGRTRNSKSFRHTYIMMRILKSGGRADLMKLARNCGVSPEVINRHYASHLSSEMVAEDLIHVAGDADADSAPVR